MYEYEASAKLAHIDIANNYIQICCKKLPFNVNNNLKHESKKKQKKIWWPGPGDKKKHQTHTLSLILFYQHYRHLLRKFYLFWRKKNAKKCKIAFVIRSFRWVVFVVDFDLSPSFFSFSLFFLLSSCCRSLLLFLFLFISNI